MRNIVQMIGTDDFPRIRIGTDKPKFDINLADYVLMPFSKDEETTIAKAVNDAAMAVEKIICCGIQKAMNEFNG